MSRTWEGHPPAMDKDNAKRILLEVKEVLDKNDVEFWLCFATCLGAVREGDFIDNDFDIDLGIKHYFLWSKLYADNDRYRIANAIKKSIAKGKGKGNGQG